MATALDDTIAPALDDTIAQNLECPLCASTFTDPKILPCSHTFCKGCIERLSEVPGHRHQRIRCPVCRAEINVQIQDVSKLPTNLALRNLIEDMKKQRQPLPVSKFQKCKKHPKEDEECFCSSCRKFVCYRCVVADHAGERHHQIIMPDAYERSHVKSMKILTSKIDHKCSCLQKYVNFIDGEKERVRKAQMKCADEITDAHDALVLQLAEQKNNLIDEVKDKATPVDKDFDEIKKSVLEQITNLTTIAGMVMNGAKVPFDIDSLAVHESLCEDLKEVLNEEDPDYEKPRKASKEVESVSFRRNVENDTLDLGRIVKVTGVDIVLPRYNSMNTMVCTPDGKMAVGCAEGGIQIFSSDGKYQQSLLKDVTICGLGFLSDGRCVVLDSSNTIILYTPEYTKMNEIFNTLGAKEGGNGNLTVDGDDRIYVTYEKAKKIQVFSSEGNVEAEIPCHGYEPYQVRSYNDSLIVSSYFFNKRVRLIDKQGVVKHAMKSFHEGLYPAVSRRNTILIAKVTHELGLVSISEYTNKLKHIGYLVENCKIKKPQRQWYCLQQYRSGEIAFCSPDSLHIF